MSTACIINLDLLIAEVETGPAVVRELIALVGMVVTLIGGDAPTYVCKVRFKISISRMRMQTNDDHCFDFHSIEFLQLNALIIGLFLKSC